MEKEISCGCCRLFIWLCSLSISAYSASGDPESSVDYVAALNELARQGRNESLNAAIFYQKAALLYVDCPAGLDLWDVYAWPSELTDKKRSLLRHWALANSRAFARLKLGTKKPYLWNEYHGQMVVSVHPVGLTELGGIMRARLSHVKLAAAQVGVTRQTREDILACFPNQLPLGAVTQRHIAVALGSVQ